jgi:hypothetical protein
MPEDLFYELVHHKLTWYYHIWAISPNLYKKHPKLAETLQITALDKDSKGNIYVASSQGIKYPVIFLI